MSTTIEPGFSESPPPREPVNRDELREGTPPPLWRVCAGELTDL